nr:probable G-protein coupled receptor Mth-like 3 [Helicoverpa armigera]
MINFISLFTILVIILESVSNTKLCNKEESVELKNQKYYDLKFEDNETISDIHHGRETKRGCMYLKGPWTRKCCPMGQAYHMTARTCVRYPGKLYPMVFALNYTVLKRFNITEEFNFKYEKVVCEKNQGEKTLPVYPAARSFYLLKNGNLVVKIPEHNPPYLIYTPDKYCFDTFVSKTQKFHRNALICYQSKLKYAIIELSSSCRLVSCFYIMLTVVLYACLPELRNLPGLTLMTFLFCFCIFFMALSIKQILILKKLITRELCIGLTVITYFFQISSKFWLNIMCYDIWWTFSLKRSRPWGGTQHMRYLFYSFYAFGIPFVMTSLTVALGYFLTIRHRLLPKIQTQPCFFNSESFLFYLYGPTLVLFVADLVLLVLTSVKVVKIKRDTKVVDDKEAPLSDQDTEDIRRFVLYLKLFGVKCIYWSLDVFTNLFPEGDFVWQFFDAFNLVVGFAIFILVAWKKRNWKLIKKRYKQLKGYRIYKTDSTISCSTISRFVSLDEEQMNSQLST